jgi:hypothetical protein
MTSSQNTADKMTQNNADKTQNNAATCECCGDKTTQPLTFYPAFYPEPAQWICVECVEETERLLEEMKDDESEDEEDDE